MTSAANAHPLSRDGRLVLTGYGIRLYVERGHLHYSDGVGSKRRLGRFARPTRDLKRVIVIGHSGTITLDAFRWLSDIGAGFVQLDSDGRIITAAGPIGLRDAQLRRAQAVATISETGLAISKSLIREKLRGQQSLLTQLPLGEASADAMEASIQRIDAAENFERLRLIEADGAAAYWKAWSPVEIQFVRKDLGRVPEHWIAFGRRASLLTRSPRKATNPINALLNYLYGILEAETRIAAIAVGLDPGMGIMHADQGSRDSLALDLMEAVRPEVDRYALKLLGGFKFSKSDFFETRDGTCRVMPPISTDLAGTASRWASLIAPIVEQVAAQLASNDHAKEARPRSSLSRRLPTPLTETNRSRGRAGVRERKSVKGASSGQRASELTKRCPDCGESIGHGRRYCASCLPARYAVGAAIQSETLRKMRAAGRDPRHSKSANHKRGRSVSVHARANHEWSSQGCDIADPADFLRQMGPRLALLKVSEMVERTGLSRAYCLSIKKGLRVPHPRHWRKLAPDTSGHTSLE